MFGLDKAKKNGNSVPHSPESLPPEAADSSESILAASLSIRGEVNFEGAIRIEGNLEGRATGQGILTVGPGGRVVGDIMAAQVVVHGVVQGNITAADRLELAGTAQVFGDLKAGRLVVAEGAKLMGRVEIDAESMTPPSMESPPRVEAGAPKEDALSKVF